ncbi:hypothetical protein TrCOL_g11164 [Triparma columacea]|uniref:Sugar phosphate transporter domain-containing protein n=1 Tax=Triparma columacea TaxID=722753 RepID=A0A9W7GN70_9STRA|nr:hypothetical protein TrCOL_g11164 [Triparma columacea]
MNIVALLPSLMGWFLFSSLLSIYNKFVFGTRGFPYPLFMTSFHFLLQWIVSYILTTFYPLKFYNLSTPSSPTSTTATTPSKIKSKSTTAPSFLLPLINQISSVPPMTLDSFSYITSGGVSTLPILTFLSLSLPIGLTSSLDISLSNVSLSLISLSTYVMIKSTAPVWVATFAISLGIETLSKSLVLVVGLISIGEVVTVSGNTPDVASSVTVNATSTMTSGGEEAFGNPLGVFLCLLASVLSGLRWTLVQLLLKCLPDSYRTPMVTVRITAPTMWLATLVASLVVEEPWNIGGTVYGEDIGKALETLAVAVVGGGIAVMMILCEFSLILKSTAVVLMIGGVLKEVFTIVLGVAIFGDKLTGRNMAGFAIVLFGVAVFKTRHMGEGEEEGGSGGSLEDEDMEVDVEDGDEDGDEMIELVKWAAAEVEEGKYAEEEEGEWNGDMT